MDQRRELKSATQNQLEENVVGSLEQIGTGGHFLNISLVAQRLILTTNKWDFLKLKNIYKAKDTVNKT